MGIVSELLDRTTPREAAWRMAHARDFALVAADWEYDAISRADRQLAAALRKWGDANGDA